MIRRILVLSAVACAALAVGLAVPAGATVRQSYPGCSAVISDTTPSAGETVHISGTGAGKTVTALLDGTVIGSTTSDSAGNFAFDVTIPATTAAGTHTLSVDCDGSAPGTSVEGITITVGGGTSTGPLPTTGTSDTLPLTKLAVVLLGAGGLLLVVSRRRSTKSVKTDA